MATAAGSECLCCNDRRAMHGLDIVLTTVTALSAPPAIYTAILKSHLMAGVIYEQYFCDFAVCQLKDLYFTKGHRHVKYYIHCHCLNPGSLQCTAAKTTLLTAFKNMGITLYDSQHLILPQLCCNTWLCTPITFLGSIRSNKYHCYCFQMMEGVDPIISQFPPSYPVVTVAVHSSLFLLYVFCKCESDELSCARACSDRINLLRLFLCCQYESYSYRPSKALELNYVTPNRLRRRPHRIQVP